MGSIRVLGTNKKLFIDFRYKGKRCREYTTLDDTPANRKKLQKILERIETEIKLGTFDYARFFPGSRMATKLATGPAVMPMPASSPAVLAAAQANVVTAEGAPLPTFAEFARVWVAENEVAWRRSNRKTVDDILRSHLLPVFGEKAVGQITKADILTFRSTLAKVPGRKAETLSAKRINAIMAPLRQILNEAADRFEFTTPFRNIKPLKVQRSDVDPPPAGFLGGAPGQDHPGV